MHVKEYQIQRIADADEDLLHQWQINMLVAPNWFERAFLAKTEERLVLRGSLEHWCWGTESNTSPDSYLWRTWAYAALRRHEGRTKSSGFISRFSKSKNNADSVQREP